MGSWARQDLWQGGGWWTQRGDGLWNGAGQATASRPYKVEAGRPSEVVDCGTGQAV